VHLPLAAAGKRPDMPRDALSEPFELDDDAILPLQRLVTAIEALKLAEAGIFPLRLICP
jgi:hypothetical protein